MNARLLALRTAPKPPPNSPPPPQHTQQHPFLGKPLLPRDPRDGRAAAHHAPHRRAPRGQAPGRGGDGGVRRARGALPGRQGGGKERRAGCVLLSLDRRCGRSVGPVIHSYPSPKPYTPAGADQGGRPAERGGARGGRPAGTPFWEGWGPRPKRRRGRRPPSIDQASPTNARPSSPPGPTQALSVACKREHAACWPVVHLTSSRGGLGIAELREGLAALMFHDDDGHHHNVG